MKTLYILSDSNGVGQYVTLHKTWPHLLSVHLEGRYTIQNVSRNGETTRQALERLVPDVLRYEPDIVYVQYGSNDGNHWETDRGLPRLFYSEYESNIMSIVMRCNHFGASVIFGLGHRNPMARGLQKNLGHLNYIDHTNYCGDYLMPDGVHLNELGHKLYFENIAEAIP